jgi:serine/threonine protein kinase
MLQALDHIAFKGIIHRDVKPENILYTYLPAGGYTFQLTDFGVCNAMTDARTLTGSPKYMAPEFFSNPGILQTPKVDVWSLFVTLAEATNVDGFQQKPFNTNELRVRRVAEATNNPDFGPLRDMAIVDPSRRASAGEMLDKLFNGEGRSTPRNEIRDGARLASTAT